MGSTRRGARRSRFSGLSPLFALLLLRFEDVLGAGFPGAGFFTARSTSPKVMILMNFWNPVGFGAVLRRMISGSLSNERLPRGGRELSDSPRDPSRRESRSPLRELLRRLRSPPPLRDPPRVRELLLRFRSPPDDEFCMGLNKVSSQSGTPREAELIMAVGRDIFPAGVKSDSPGRCVS